MNRTLGLSSLVCIIPIVFGGCSGHDGGGYETYETLCSINLSKSKFLATFGSTQSARELRDYYNLCPLAKDENAIEKWGEVAAKRGNKMDEKDYIKILEEDRFEKGGREWRAPDCSKSFKNENLHELDKVSDTVLIHERIAYEAECKEPGISHDMMLLAKRAAELGSVDDVAFYNKLLNIKPLK